MARILPVVGCKNAGKTRTCEVLIPPLQALGLAVGTLKHTEHEEFEWDVPGKDTDRHRRAGSAVTGIFGGQRFAFSFNRPGSAEVPLDALIRAFYGDLDLVLLEGYQRDPGLRLEVCRPNFSTIPISPRRPFWQPMALSCSGVEHATSTMGRRRSSRALFVTTWFDCAPCESNQATIQCKMMGCKRQKSRPYIAKLVRSSPPSSGSR